MAQVTQQEFQAQQTATKLAEQKPVNTSFLDDMFGEGGFSLDEDSGEMLFTPQQSETSNTEDVVASAPVSEPKPEDSGAVSPDASEQRIASLESSLNQVLEMLATKIVPALNQKQATQEQQFTEDDELDYNDPSSLKKMIASQIEASLAKVLGPLQQTQQKTEKYMEASETFNKYGQDFTEKIPVIKELMTVDTSLTFENAYLLAKRIEAHFPKLPANSNGNSQTPTPQATKPASALREKAEKLQTVNGVNPTGQVKPTKYNTVQAAFEAAMAEFEQGF